MQRIDNFSGSEEQYITYLESKCTTLRQSRNLILQKYQQLVRHHQNCSVPLGLPSPTKSSEDLEDQTPPLGLADISTVPSSPQQTSGSSSPLQASIVATPVTHACPSLKVVEWNYGRLPRNRKRGGSNKSHNGLKPPRWLHLAENLIELTPTSNRWWQALTDAGIGSMEQVSTALEFLLQHNTSKSIFPHLPKIDSSTGSTHDELLLSYATSYANALDARNMSTQLTLMLVNFSKFLFIDLCIVLEDQGVKKDSVNTMMRIVISDATDLTLDRVKRAVKWINTASDQLSARWGLRAGLLPLLWRRPPSYFTQFAENNDSLDFIVKTLSHEKYTKQFALKERWLDLFTPFLVDNILRKRVPISQIAEALGYQNSQMFETDGTLLVQHPWLLFDETR